MGCDFRIIDENYFFATNTGLTASTEDAAFPVTNIRNQIRARVWRSNVDGYFRVESTNKYIDFDIGGGELNAVLTEDEYTASELATHITSVLTAAAGVAVTCAYSTTTGRWTFSKASGTLSLLFDTGANTLNSASAMLGFDDVSDYTGALSYLSARIALHTEEFIKMDIKTSEAVDSIAMIFDPTFGNHMSVEAVVKIQANATPNFDSPALDLTLSYDEDHGAYSYFWTTDQTYRYWKLKIVDPSNPNLNVEVGKVILGKATKPTRSAEIGFIYRLSDRSKININDYGNSYADVYPIKKDIEFNLKLLVTSDLDALSNIFERNGNSRAMLIVMDAQEALFDKDRFLFYGFLVGEMQFQHVIAEYFDLSMKFTEAL